MLEVEKMTKTKKCWRSVSGSLDGKTLIYADRDYTKSPIGTTNFVSLIERPHKKWEVTIGKKFNPDKLKVKILDSKEEANNYAKGWMKKNGGFC